MVTASVKTTDDSSVVRKDDGSVTRKENGTVVRKDDGSINFRTHDGAVVCQTESLSGAEECFALRNDFERNNNTF